MGIKKEFGKQIKKMRLSRGLTQEKLSELIDISQRSLSKIESGENFVTAETIDKLLVALNTTTEEIFATNHLKDIDELRKEIDEKLDIYMNDAEKIETVYKILMHL